VTSLVLAFSVFPVLASAASLPEPSVEKLPRWRGFNLLEKFNVGREEPFQESDFQWISELGFNFVRLPMDYRCWIQEGDWTQFDEGTLKEIDQAVNWGQKYGIHVSLNFHRAPGYTVAQPPEDPSLWEDEETQRICALHWATFARRYKDIPNRQLSFNLLNEPGDMEEKVHDRVIVKLVDAIRKEDPGRLILVDGLSWCALPCEGLKHAGVAQCTRGYFPGSLTHHQASWSGYKDAQAVPEWPMYPSFPSYLYGSYKKEWSSPLVLKGPFPEMCRLSFVVGTVSTLAQVEVRSGNNVLLSERFICGEDPGPWKETTYLEKWDCYQCVFDKECETLLPPGTKRVEIEMKEGDWLRLKQVQLRPWPGCGEEGLLLYPDAGGWGKKQERLVFANDGKLKQANKPECDQETLWRKRIKPWKRLERKGVGVMVGEWGSYNKTPHDVTLAWMRDCLENWDKAGWGWALWNFRGSFGILDSGREDVEYESWRGHALDRKMLELLQQG